jgi:two-component system cell cycle sensor histidine kinase PleC
MDGLTLLQKLHEADDKISTIIVSAYGDMSNIRTAMNRGAFDFLTKPIDFSDFEATIAKTIRHVELLREAKRRQEENERLQSATRNKSRFLANVSHELRTPLNAIIGFSEVMQEEMFGPLGSGKYTEYSHDIHKSGQFLLDVINDILDMSKIEAGRMELELTTLSLPSIIDDIMRFVGPRAAEGRVEIILELPKACNITADRRALKQVFINLMSNAVKFTPEGGQVKVSVSKTKEGARVTISDTGIGIPHNDIEKLGRPFEQVENQFTKSKGGSGLGLAISKSLVDLHNGSLTIASTVGSGTTVTVELLASPTAENSKAA